MRYNFNTFNRYMRRIKPEQDIRINELKRVISIIKCRLEYQRTKEMYIMPSDDEEAKLFNRGFYAACDSLIDLLEACILDYEGKL